MVAELLKLRSYFVQASEQLTEEAPHNATSQPEQSSSALLDGHHPSQPACQTQEEGQGPPTACQSQEQGQGLPTASQSLADQLAEVEGQAAQADAQQPRASPAGQGEEPRPVQGEEPQQPQLVQGEEPQQPQLVQEEELQQPQLVQGEEPQPVQPGNWLIKQLLVVTGLGGGSRPKQAQPTVEAPGRKRGRGKGSSGGGSQGHDSKRVKLGNEGAGTMAGGCTHCGGTSPGGHR